MTTPQEQEKVSFQEIIEEYRTRLAQETEKNIVLECRLRSRDSHIAMLESQADQMERE